MTETWTQSLKDSLTSAYPPSTIREYIEREGSPLLLLDLQVIRNNYRALKSALPRVDHYYAVKSFSHLQVLTTLKSEEAYFDLATSGEIELMKQLGIDPSRCIYTHPIVRESDVRAAVEFGIKTFVIDSEYQLASFKPFAGQVELLLRIAIPNEEAQINLSAKFGIAPIWAMDFFEKAKASGLRVVGISFHAGSQMYDASKMVEGIRVAHKLFAEAESVGHDMKLLDIGGGFPAAYSRPIPEVREFCAPVSEVLDELFPNCRIVSEPGRGISAGSVVSVSRVMGKSLRNGVMWYYLDDGLYGTYSGVLFEHGDYPIFTLKELEDPNHPKKTSVLAGPTCDSVDVISQDIALPDLDTGDIIISPNMGAYSAATTTDFNLFPRAKVVIIS